MMMDSNDDAHAVTTAVPSSPLPPPQQLKIYHVILDLDGTLIDTGRYSVFLLFLQSRKRRKLTQPPDLFFLLRWVCLLLKTSSSSSEDLIIIFILSETLVEEALELIVSGYGKKWNGEGAHKRLGKRPLESAASLIQDYDLPCTPQELYSQILDFMKNRHANSSDPSFFFYSQLFFALLPQNPCLFFLFNRVFPSRYHLLE